MAFKITCVAYVANSGGLCGARWQYEASTCVVTCPRGWQCVVGARKPTPLLCQPLACVFDCAWRSAALYSACSYRACCSIFETISRWQPASKLVKHVDCMHSVPLAPCLTRGLCIVHPCRSQATILRIRSRHSCLSLPTCKIVCWLLHCCDVVACAVSKAACGKNQHLHSLYGHVINQGTVCCLCQRGCVCDMHSTGQAVDSAKGRCKLVSCHMAPHLRQSILRPKVAYWICYLLVRLLKGCGELQHHLA